MSSLLAYSGIVTKTRAMQKHLLTEDQFRELVSLPDVPAAAAYLRQIPGYERLFTLLGEQEIHRGGLEFYLKFSAWEDFIKLYRFADDKTREFLKAYAMRYETAILKRFLNGVLAGKEPDPGLQKLEPVYRRYTCLNFRALFEARDIDTLIDALRRTPYQKVLRSVRQRPEAALFDYESALDVFAFSDMWNRKEEFVSKDALPAFTEYLGCKYDLLNLWYISRAKTYYHMDAAGIYGVLIPVYYKLSKKEIQSLAEAGSAEDFREIFAKTWYACQIPDPTPEALQALHTDTCRKILVESAKKQPYSLMTIYAYMYQKEHEIYRLVTAIECVRYGLSPEEAMHHIIVR